MALEQIGEYGPQASSAIPVIAKRLSDKSLVVVWISNHVCFEQPLRVDACIALGKIGPAAQEALPQLREMMRLDSESSVRVASALAVSQIDLNTDEGIQVLMDELPSGANALGELGPRAARAYESLERLWDQEKKQEFHEDTALIALARINGSRSLNRLIEALEQDEEILIREAVASQLGDLGEVAIPAVPALIQALDLKQEDIFVDSLRASAATALGQIGPAAREALPALVKLRDGDVTDSEKAAAMEAISRIDRESP